VARGPLLQSQGIQLQERHRRRDFTNPENHVAKTADRPAFWLLRAEML
jgi:hypothetical protein